MPRGKNRMPKGRGRKKAEEQSALQQRQKTQAKLGNQYGKRTNYDYLRDGPKNRQKGNNSNSRS